jgi:hypothetical protein
MAHSLENPVYDMPFLTNAMHLTSDVIPLRPKVLSSIPISIEECIIVSLFSATPADLTFTPTKVTYHIFSNTLSHQICHASNFSRSKKLKKLLKFLFIEAIKYTC